MSAAETGEESTAVAKGSELEGVLGTGSALADWAGEESWLLETKEQEEKEQEEKASKMWELIREWIGVLGAVVAVWTASIAYEGQNRQAELAERQTELEIRGYLYEAWDLLGGETGTEKIRHWERDPQKLVLAARLIGDALTLDPDHAHAWRMAGDLWRARNDHKRAEAAYRRALGLDPDSSSTNNNLGRLLKDLERYDEAESALRRALELDPNNASVHNNLGEVLLDLERYDEAESALRRALELDSKHTYARTNLGIALIRLGRPDEADSAFRSAREVDPDALAHDNLGAWLLGRTTPQPADTGEASPP